MEINPNFSFRAREDYRLVKRALEQHDEQAFTDLMSRYRDSVYYLLLRMVRSHEDSEDLVLEAFSKAFNHLPKYDPQFSFSTWLYKIAINSAIDFIRKRKREKADQGRTVSLNDPLENAENETLEGSLAAEGLDPQERFIKSQRSKIVHEIVAQLSPRYRVLIEMRYFRELSYQEIAQELNQPLGTIKAQLSRAKDVMLNILKNTGEKI